MRHFLEKCEKALTKAIHCAKIVNNKFKMKVGNQNGKA
jgi:hypothetical protein